MSPLNFDQRQTMAAYFGYILSSAGQTRLSTAFMARLPSALTDSLRMGFVANF